MSGKVYRITNTVDNKVYIGSTFQSLKDRFCMHKEKHFYGKSHLYQHMRITGFGNYHIELLREFGGCRDDLRRLESIELLKIAHDLWLNQRMPHKDYCSKRRWCETCECSVMWNKIARHKRTKKHNQSISEPCVYCT